MSANSRKKNLLLNSTWGMIAVVLSTAIAFALRAVLAHTLGEDIYGINTLFSSIINTLLIMELGISTAMVIYLYEPVAKDDRERIKAIIRLYRDVYRIFCLVFLCSGFIVALFFLPSMVATTIPINIVRGYFALFIISITAKYLWSYKRALLYANQRNRVSTIFTTSTDLFFGAVEIIILLCFENYLLYLLLFVAQNITSNALCNIFINKNYPYILENVNQPVTKVDKINIFNTIKPMFVQRIAGVVQDSSNTIILSFMSSTISIVGFYGNYQLIIHTLETIYGQIGASFTTGFGNLYVQNTKDYCFDVFCKSNFSLHWISTIISVSFLVLAQGFISIVFGNDYVLRDIIVIILTLYLYFFLNNIVVISVQNALGSHRLDAKQMIYQTVLNVCLSLLFGYFFGLPGILAGSLISVVLFSTFYKGIVHYKYIFSKPSSLFVLTTLCNFIRFVITAVITFISARLLFKSSSILLWLLCAVFTLVTSNIILLLLSFRIKEFAFVKNYVTKHVKR